MCIPLSLPLDANGFSSTCTAWIRCFYFHCSICTCRFSALGMFRCIIIINSRGIFIRFIFFPASTKKDRALFILTAKINYHCSKNMKMYSIFCACGTHVHFFTHLILAHHSAVQANEFKFSNGLMMLRFIKSVNGEYYVQLIHDLKDMQKHVPPTPTSTLRLTRYSVQSIHKHAPINNDAWGFNELIVYLKYFKN